MAVELEEKEELTFKVLLVGDIGTGKTSFNKRYVENKFSIHYKATIGSDFSLKILDWDDNLRIKLQIWDVAGSKIFSVTHGPSWWVSPEPVKLTGQERFSVMTRVFYRDAVGAFVLFDVTRAKTFECAGKWKNDLDTKTSLPNGYPIPTVLIANKCDQESLFSVEKIDQFCEDKGFCKWFETSAKDNIGITPAVHYLVKKILERSNRELTPIPRGLLTPVHEPGDSANDSAVAKKKKSHFCC